VDAVSGVYVPHVENAGVENLSVNGGDDDNVDFNYCAYCWAKGVESSVFMGSAFGINNSFRVEVRDFYGHDAAYSQPGGGAYLIANGLGIIGKSFRERHFSENRQEIVARAAGAGSVVAYNYADMSFIDYNENWVEIGINASHFVGPHHVLFEGNYAQNGDSDNTHGDSDYMLFFRNWLSGIRHSFVNPETGHTIDDASQNVGQTARCARWSDVRFVLV